MPRSLKLYSDGIIQYPFSVSSHTNLISFFSFVSLLVSDVLSSIIWVLLKGENYWELPSSYTQKKFLNGLTSAWGMGEEGGDDGAFLQAVSHHLCQKHPRGVGCLEEGNASHILVLYYASQVGGLLLSCGRRPLFFYLTETI